MEVAETEELYNNPIHPYTKSLLSAVPIPDPILERKKVLKVYDPNQHDYSVDKPEMVEVRPGHFVWGNKTEIETYRKEQSKKVISMQKNRVPKGTRFFFSPNLNALS